MARDRLVQLIALVVMLVATVASGAMLPGLIEKSDRHALRYTNESVKGAPPIVALGTAIGALRGLIVDYLWIKVHIMKEKGLFYEVMADTELITKLQPRFAAVWAFHGHNMAYNISVATNTQEERWRWVNAGIRLVRDEGLRYNPNDLQLHRELAFWFAHKIEGVVDDAHLYYKTEFCREWHINLGEPPDGLEERIAWMKEIADAPQTLAEAIAREPLVAELVEKLKNVPSPFKELSEIPVDRPLLQMYARWREYRGGSTAAAVTGRLQEAMKDPYFTGFDAIANDPQYARAWAVLLAHVRRRVLVDQYNMDPQLMYQFTRDLGPIDWRNAQAHALYWSRRGWLKAEDRVVSEDDVYMILNNDRIQMQAMQGLARFGRIYFDHQSRELPTRLPDPRWIDTIEREFERLYAKNINTRGGGPETFIGFFQNFMNSAIREWYRGGEEARARQAMAMMDRLFGTGQSDAIGHNPKYSLPLEVFVREETREEYEFQPHLAPSEVAAALRYGLLVGIGADRPEVLERALAFAAEVDSLFRYNEYNDYVTKFGSARMAEILNQLGTMQSTVFAQIMIDRSVGLPTRVGIWGRADQFNPEWRLRTYDRVRPVLERELAGSMYAAVAADPAAGVEARPGWTIDQILPEPPGLEAFRLAEAERLQREEAERQAERDRDEMLRRGGASQ